MLLLVFPEASAQFVKSPVVLVGTHNSGVNWVDIDIDGDLDLSVSGDSLDIDTGRGKLYLNNIGIITFNRDIRATEDGDQKWSDFNNDGYPDLLYAGDADGKTAGIDTFDVSLNYYNKYTGFTVVTDASVDWGDYDNDGDYDVLIAGQDASGLIRTDLYKNDNGVFINVNAGLPGVIVGKVAFVDYDLDMDLDIFISGRDVNINKYTRLWKNTGGSFQVTNDIFINLDFSQFDWGDFNNDGYPDLILGGLNNSIPRGFIYLNNAGTSFTQSNMKVPGARYGSSAFGDVDNDGDLDAFISGYKASEVLKTRYIFENNSTDSLIPMAFTSDYVSRSFIQFGDYNGDNKLDFVTNGMDEDWKGRTYIADNTTAVANSKPSKPQNLEALIEGTSVILKWDPSTDYNTEQKALTYNIYVGTSSEGIDIVSPIADISTGFRRISRQGYIQDTAWIIKNLPVGTYYWGVQAIDNALGASLFSDEATFEIKNRFTDVQYTETDMSTSPAIYFDCDHDNDLDMVLNYSNSLLIVENTLTSFSQANYRTIFENGCYYIYTITPNDYNNDNLMDLTISGDYPVDGLLDSTIALIEYNNPFSYEIIDSALVKDVSFEYALWVDLNNDGRQDLITSGKTLNLGINNKPVTYILKNLGDGNFQKIYHSIRGFEKTGAVSGDFDNDLDVDIIIYGLDSLGVANTYLYINNGNFSFSENLILNNELYRNNLEYQIYTGDFDLNGELDIYMAGITVTNDKYARVLLNNDMNFTDANLPVRSSGTMSNFWADYDYDGDLDIYSVNTYGTPDNKVRLYLNNNCTLNETITDLGASYIVDLPFTAVNLDNKNGLDFVVKNPGGIYNQYFDNWGSDGRINTAPANTHFDQDQLDIILKWDKLTSCPACTYNIRVGTQPDNVNIMSPMSDLSTGYRYVVQPGNAYLNDSWKLCDLPVGKYYWSVQAVDPANTGGPWAPEDSFTVSLIDADFSFTTICRGDSTEFTDLSVSTEAITGWKWNFGDGYSSNLQKLKHLYANAGTFTAGLWAYSESGDSAYQEYDVMVKAVPDADFTADITCQGTPTTFINNTNANGTTILSWLWNFGDDSEPSTLEEPGTHGYINSGDYEVDLVATADNGCVDLITKTVTVSSYPVTLISADALLTFCKGDSVTLSVPHNNSYTYNWMAGGTSITGGDNSKYVARLSGNYNVEVINPVGDCRDTSSMVTVTSIDAPVAPLISADGDLEFCQGDSVILSVTNTAGYTYQWKLNGGAVGTDSYSMVAKNPGEYNLVVTNSNLCSAVSSNSVNVVVNQLPAAETVNLSGSSTFCEGGSVTLSVSSSAGYTYHWRNENGFIPVATTTSYSTGTEGIYQLEITNTYGCTSRTLPVNVTVKPMPYKPLVKSDNYQPGECMGETPLRLDADQVVPEYSYQWYRNGIPVPGETSSTLEDFLTEGDYSLEADLNGCTAESDVINVFFEDAPNKPSLSAQGPTVWYLTCSIRDTSLYKYRWYCNGKLITGANNYYYIAGRKMGEYQVSIGNSLGCYTISDVLSIPSGDVGIDDIDPFEGLNIYPNPTTGLFTIEIDNNLFGKLWLRIITENGKEVMSLNLDKTTEHFMYEVDLSGQSKGLYIINLLIDRHFATRKVIVE